MILLGGQTHGRSILLRPRIIEVKNTESMKKNRGLASRSRKTNDFLLIDLQMPQLKRLFYELN